MICQFIDWLLAGLPLLDNDSEDSDEIDMKTAATKSSRHRLRSTNSNSDDNYLKETRTWTSVRDKHLQFKSEGPKTSDIFRETSAGTRNNASDCGIKEEQIINLSLSDDWIFIMFYTYLVLTSVTSVYTVSFDWFLSGLEWILNLEFCNTKIFNILQEIIMEYQI